MFLRFLTIVFGFFLLPAVCGAVDIHPLPTQDLPASCNANFWQSMRWRAGLEAEREIEIAGALLLKPDSVLEYSCFRNRINNLKVRATEMFSANVGPQNNFREQGTNQQAREDNGTFLFNPDGTPLMDGMAGRLFSDPVYSWTPNDRFQPGSSGNPELGVNPAIISPYGPADNGEGIEDDDYPGSAQFNETMKNMVEDSLDAYLGTNFGHTPLGGVFENNVPTCDVMNQVWEFSRCNDYYMQIGYEHIADFNLQYNAWPEEWAKQCGEASVSANIFWDNSQLAPGDDGGVDVMDGVFEDHSTVKCESDKYVLTGLNVIYKEDTQTVDAQGNTKRILLQNSHPEGICVTPGCYYDPEAQRCKR